MIAIVCIMFLYCHATSDYVTPTVNLTSCMYNIATVTIKNAPEGGLLYFRTDTAYNMITTTAGTLIHECTFEECNINWDEKFYVIVQRQVLYQTRDDVIIWFICNTDFGAVTPVEIDLFDNTDGNLTTINYKPEVAMTLYRAEERLDSGSEVKLGDDIIMIIRVTNNEEDFFDIAAKSCYASSITIMEDHCPTDDELFGPFNSTAVGYLSTTFNMFRPTNIAGGPTEVVFTCILEVCLWNCPETDCSSDTITNRRKRDDGGGSSDVGNIPNIVRGYRLVALADGEETFVRSKEPTNHLCVPLYVIVAVGGATLIVIGAGVTVYTASFRKFLIYNKTVAHMKKLNDARRSKETPSRWQVECLVSHVTGSDPMQSKVYGITVLQKQHLQQPRIQNPYRRKSVTLAES